ncbi:hypothetical protein LINPERHAP1_LOCUS41596 [Linum perenne]
MATLQFSQAHLSFYRWIIEVIILLSSLSILIWICLTPHPPLYTVVNTSFIDDNNTSSLALDLEISNPNQGYRVHYTSTSVSLAGSIVGKGYVLGFEMGYGETSLRRVVVNGTNGRGDSGVLRVRLVVGVEYEDKVIAMRSKRKEIEYGGGLRLGVDGKIEGGKQVAMLSMTE